MGVVTREVKSENVCSSVQKTSSQRFSRESKEMWEKVQTKDCLENVTRASKQEACKSGSAPEEKKTDNTESPQPPVRRIQPKAPTSGDIFPRKVKSKLVKIKPALWEKNDEKLKNTILKKEKRKTKLG